MEISIKNLPNEILLKIFYSHSISAEDLISLSNVCRRFYSVCYAEQNLWKSKFVKRWPLAWKKIDSGSIESTSKTNWKEKVEISVRTSKEIENILSSISYHSYEFKSIPLPILSSICRFHEFEKFVTFVALEELRRERTDLTHLYYAKQLFYHLKNYLSLNQIKEFFHLPTERQTLERGVYYVAKGIQPEYYHETDYDEVSIKLDKLALEVQSYLKTKSPNHPAASIELFSPDLIDEMEYSKWSDEETCELIECLNLILCSKHTLRKNDDIQNIFLQKIVEKTPEEDKYFLFIYLAVSHRLGLSMKFIYQEDRFDFAWKSSKSKNYVCFHPYPKSDWNNYVEVIEYLINQHHTSPIEMIIDLVRSSTYNILEANTGLFPENIATFGIILLFFYSYGDYIDSFYRYVIYFCLKHELHLELISDIMDRFEYATTPWGEKVILDNFISTQVKKVLKLQREGTKIIMPKNRMERVDVQFATGMIVTYKERLNPGVIFGWDKYYAPKIDLEIDINFNSLKYGFDQPFYRILFTNEVEHYAAQETLSVMTVPVPVMHFEVGKYFKRFNGTFYEPNNELRSEYPDDETVRNELYTKNGSELSKKENEIMEVE